MGKVKSVTEDEDDPWRPRAAKVVDGPGPVEEVSDTEELLEPGDGSGESDPGSGFDVVDEHLEDALDEAQERFGTAYDEIFDHADYRNMYGDSGSLGLTTYEVNGIERFNDIAVIDDDTRLFIDDSLKFVDQHEVLGEEDLYHVIGHEGIHGEIFSDRYGAEMRSRGVPVPTLMALFGLLKQGEEEEIEAVTEYSARLRNPEFPEVKLDAYGDLVYELEEELSEQGLNLDTAREKIVEGSGKALDEVADIEYVDADRNYYLEHGYLETGEGEQEYILALGEDERIEDYLGKELDDDTELYEGENPLEGGDSDPLGFEDHLEDLEDENYRAENGEGENGFDSARKLESAPADLYQPEIDSGNAAGTGYADV